MLYLTVLTSTSQAVPSSPGYIGVYHAAVTLALVACCLVNPYGANLLKFPFALTSSSFMGEIYEWQPPLTSDFAASGSFKSPGAIKPLGRDCRMNCRLIVLTFNGLSSADLKSRFLALPGLRRQAGNDLGPESS